MDLLPKLLQLFKNLSDSDFKDVTFELNYETQLRQYYSEITSYSNEERLRICDSLYAVITDFKPEIQVYILSFLAHTAPSTQYTKELIQLCRNDEIFSPETQFYFYYQINHKQFVHTYESDSETSLMLARFYKHIYLRYKETVSEEMLWIPPVERNKNFIVVMTSQLISMSHAPTKTAYDRCYVLQKNMKKQLMLVNTSEALSYTGYHPLFNFIIPNYTSDLLDIQEIEFTDTSFRYFQFNNTTPSPDSINDILSFIRRNKPYCIFTIGGSSIMADMCSNLVPTVSISLAFSDLTITEGTFQLIGRNINEDDISFVKQLGKPKEHLLSSIFTFSFRPQTTHFTRSELNLPENDFLALIVGGRLNEEVQNDFLEMMKATVEHNVHFVFAGSFSDYESCMKQHPELRDSCTFIGFMNDILAVNECCDIYVNPRRIGGGSSVAEALYKGLPVVSLDYGDGGLNAGKDFHVADYEEMKQTIIRYATDKEFYSAMSEKAIARAAILTDSAAAFSKVLPAIEHSPLFTDPPQA